MILELATIDIQKGKNSEFEVNLAQAKEVISQAKGFQSIDFQRCIEIENRYVLFIYWDTLEDHTEGFRNSELFMQWRVLIGHFFENPPLVQHFNQVSI